MALSLSSKFNLANENIHIFCVEVTGFTPALLTVFKMQHHFFFCSVFCYILVITSEDLFFPMYLKSCRTHFLSDKLQRCAVFNFVILFFPLEIVIAWNFSIYGFFPVLCGHPNTQQTVVIGASSRSYFIQLGKNAVEYQRDINISVCQEWQIWFKAAQEDCK